MQPVLPHILSLFQNQYFNGKFLLYPYHLSEEGSNGVIYRFRDQDTLLKICLLGEGEKRQGALRFEKRLKFLAFLFSQGVPVVEPVPLADGRINAVLDDESGCWVAYAMKKVRGETMSAKVWEPVFVQAWGQTIGMLHRVTQQYPDWERSINPLSGEDLISWQSESEYFYHLVDDPEVKQKWQVIRQKLANLPVKRDVFGLIHNDPHLWNVRWNGKQAILLDFKTANHHWFAYDICCACQHVVSMLSGGMMHPIRHPEWLGDFLREFLTGYERENHLSKDWLNRLELFFAYRRLLLYTVLPGWRRSNPELERSWRKMVFERPNIMKDVRL